MGTGCSKNPKTIEKEEDTNLKNELSHNKELITIKRNNNSSKTKKSNSPNKNTKKGRASSSIDESMNNSKRKRGKDESLINSMGSIYINKSVSPKRTIIKNENNINKKNIDNEGKVLKLIKKKNKESNDKSLIEKCFIKNPLMNNLKRSSILEIVREMSLSEVEAGVKIFSQGDIGNYFYVIKEGEVDLLINDNFIKTLKSGDCFGELALLHLAPRSGTMISRKKCVLYHIDRKGFKKIVEHLSKLHYEKSKEFFEIINFLKSFNLSDKNFLIPHLVEEKFIKNNKIFSEGESANCIYFIQTGQVILKNNNDQIISKLKEGDYFGEESLILDHIHYANAIAKTNVEIFAISESTFKELYGTENLKINILLSFLKTSFLNSTIFNQIDIRLLEKEILELFEFKIIKANEIIIEKGESKIENFIVLINGSLVYKNEPNKVLFEKNQILFENEIFKNEDSIIQDDIITKSFCLILKANTIKLINLLGNSFEGLTKITEIIENLQKVNLFKTLSKIKLCKIAKNIKIEQFEKGKDLIKQGEEGSKFFIIKSGLIEIYVNKRYIRTIGENDFLGERSLLISEKRSATCKTKTDVEVYSLEKEDFLKNIENNMKNYLINRINLQDNKIELKDLNYESTLGKGNFGTVSLVRAEKNNFLYAIKSISKKQILKSGMEKHLELEKNILLEIDHPFIVKLVKCLKDKKFVYFLMEYIQGKDLFDVIREIGLLNKYQTQFYGASLLLTINYLHQHKYIFRDIKPENVMVVYNGYIRLIDFGTAKKIEDKTNTIIGTPHYMAPEVISGEGYSFQVDYWSVAVCMYEFMCGFVPFGEETDDPMTIYNAIVSTEQIKFPSNIKDKTFKKLIQGMLNKNHLIRICNLEQIQQNPWFKSFDWEGLINLSIPPAKKPELNKKAKINQFNGLNFIEYSKKNLIDWNDEENGVFDIDTKKLETEFQNF